MVIQIYFGTNDWLVQLAMHFRRVCRYLYLASHAEEVFCKGSARGYNYVIGFPFRGAFFKYFSVFYVPRAFSANFEGLSMFSVEAHNV